VSQPIERVIRLLMDAVPDVEYTEAADRRCPSCDTSAPGVAEALEILRTLP
jgi:hypothetical protein